MGGVDRGIDDDGHELHGGIALIRDTFVKAAEGKLTCHDASMTYSEGNAQILTFNGRFTDDNRPFGIMVSVPPGAPIGAYVKRAVRSVIEPLEEG